MASDVVIFHFHQKNCFVLFFVFVKLSKKAQTLKFLNIYDLVYKHMMIPVIQNTLIYKGK